MLVGARALQGAFAALLAPTALSLLTTTFSDPGERGRAFGVFGSIASAVLLSACCSAARSLSICPGAGVCS
jgi:MFS family permease